MVSNDEVYSGVVSAEGEGQLCCITRMPCSLTQLHVAVTSESTSWKCYQLGRVSEQKEWELSA